MKKNYIFKLLFLMMLFASVFTYAQSNDDIAAKNTIENIEGLTIFPNPVNNGKVYISTKYNLAKNIEIFDVLGKKVVSQVLYGKELKIQDLNPGVYILKIKEGKLSATRKLVVR
ncbi:T9SS type A sorting domain-containing protein [Flavobacteriaceae bacterium S0825]|uniref:T9SS type A sorting domain-containing protein n=1 Tax=Gaetbulibacter sp. S0825 TaxID=2720084 RepID=UPI0014311788|nr:T9SS type A sorting domain-containing protein [Gaetbulibacter sp. S0825]MCK0107942.1 T9SS type A sorting domain-containing protein [Flavobacteriaceae bacterium S0825]NIX63578.1 T9SS type A sorting domain-containing protein [Gaetbulibacter sp. S0825]